MRLYITYWYHKGEGVEDNHHGDEDMVALAHHQPIEKLTTPAVLCTEEIKTYSSLSYTIVYRVTL